jgi:hypothetical protein
LKTEEELWNERERCSALDHKEATLDFVLVHHHKDLFPDLVSRVDNQECKLQVKDFRLRNGRFNATTSSLLALHRHHLRETMLDRVSWHRDPISTVQNGHFTNRCPQKQSNPSAVQGVNQTLNCITNTTTPARQNQAHARVNHVAVEDAQEAPDVIIGMILINDNNIIVLFDSGASHSFIAANFVQKHNLPLSTLKNQMIVSSPGEDMHARHVCSKVNILIRG